MFQSSNDCPKNCLQRMRRRACGSTWTSGVHEAMKYQLRAFQASDAAAVNAVALAAFSEFRHAYTDWQAFSGGLGQMVDMAGASEIFVAESCGQVVGAVAYVAAGQPKKAFYPEEWPIVRMLVVLPNCRGFGIGRSLTQECIRRAERDGAAVIALHTSQLMGVALPMYERMGFRLEREIPQIFGVPYGIYVKRLHGEQLLQDDRPAGD